MTSIQQIIEFRSNRGGVIISCCIDCGREAWTDYYGNYTCRPCTRFFIESIIKRSCYACINAIGICTFRRDLVRRCKFCQLQRLYEAGMMPIKFGRHENGYYMRDMYRTLNFDIDSYRHNTSVLSTERQMIRQFVSNYESIFYEWLQVFEREVMLFNQGLQTNEDPELLQRGMTIAVINDSIHVHDVLVSDYRYIDPYQCKLYSSYCTTKPILHLLRIYLSICPQCKLDLKQMLAFTFKGEIILPE
ncbi:nuclear receptor subfamily 2 group C member 2-like [Centruroides sculpturatus]|uniref:nuclear receptor subfamily 2 group C member 2-like n=1 Tax=Centruroides sculpturatus TaxID=218467 RepID=UPI000C6DC8E2|nr:nuclear receptor subfamily 2 group C member 2-like [Centruroides sculpturatus]XP_023234182.1 nuclear receptor subfamily 2 group C member 2-like [Centruroides sculpturatus]